MPSMQICRCRSLLWLCCRRYLIMRLVMSPVQSIQTTSIRFSAHTESISAGFAMEPAASGTEQDGLATDTAKSVVMEQYPEEKSIQYATKRRFLTDTDCEVCGDRSSGMHYGVSACDGCSGFFKRASRRNEALLCKSFGTCQVSKGNRKVCRACRLSKCIEAGMNLEGARRRPGKLLCLSNTKHDVEAEQMQALPLVSGTFFFSRETNSSTPNSENDQPVTHDAERTQNTTEHSNRAELVVTCKEERDLQISPAEYAMQYVTSSAGQVVQVSPVPTPHEQPAQMHNSPSPVMVSGVHSTHARQRAVVLSSAGSESTIKVTRPALSVPHVSSQRDVTSVSSYPSPPTAGAPVQSSCPPLCARSPGFCTQQELVEAVKSVSFDNNESLEEASSRLMTASIQFARNVACFGKTLFRDQVILLEESWKELFLLDAEYWALPLETPLVRGSACMSQDVEARQRGADIRSIQEALSRMKALQINLTELAHLKAILLFKPETKGLKDPDRVEKIQDEIQLMLLDYIQHRFPDQPARFGKLLLSLSGLHSLATDKHVERVFFKTVEGRDIFETLLAQLLSSS